MELGSSSMEEYVFLFLRFIMVLPIHMFLGFVLFLNRWYGMMKYLHMSPIERILTSDQHYNLFILKKIRSIDIILSYYFRRKIVLKN